MISTQQNNSGVKRIMTVGSSKLECVAATGDHCGEGAVWHKAEHAVYWVDISRFLIHRLDVKQKCVRTWFFEEPPTALALTEDDGIFLVVFSSRVSLWSPRENRIVKDIFRLPDSPAARFNDARVDPRGSLWAGTMANNVAPDGSEREITEHIGRLYSIHANGNHREWKSGLGISNTVAWSPDHSRFYFGDTLANVIWVYDYDVATGEISNERPFLKDYPKGVPDGSTIDSEGCLWNCRPYGGVVVRVAPDGKVVDEVKLPVKNPTTCVFGGEHLSMLYITSLSSDDRLEGCLFALETDTKGLPERRFKG